MLLALLLSSSIDSRPPLRSIERTEVASTAFIVRVDRLSFTKDDAPILLWEGGSPRFTVETESRIVTTAAFEPGDVLVGIRRRYDTLHVDVDGRRESEASLLLGRTLRWDVRSATFVDLDQHVRDDPRWRLLEPGIRSDWSASLPTWSGLVLEKDPVATPSSALTVARELRQLSGSDRDRAAIVAAIAELIESPALATVPATATRAGEIVRRGRPDASDALRACWRLAWSGDAGIRFVGTSKSDVELTVRARAVHEREDSTRVTSRDDVGSAHLTGSIAYTTENASWPARWTCDLDVTLEWKTRIEWR